MNFVNWLFDKLIRFYVKIFLILVILTFILTSFLEDELINLVIFTWSTAHLCIIGIAFYFHTRLRIIIKGDINRHISIISSNNVNKRKDPISVISLFPSEIPEDIKTVDTNARIVFTGLKDFPFVHCVARTIHNFSYYRYDWLKIDKSAFDMSFKSLMIGDMILYHNKRSLIGRCIRLFTRCYWEHSAIYSGSGKVIEAVPVGVIESNLSDWLLDDNVEIAVLRVDMDEEKQHEIMGFMKSTIGKRYNYSGVFNSFWVIVTGKSCDGLMTPLILFSNLLLLSIVFYCNFHAPDLPRLGLLFFSISSVYMFDCIYHWLAFKPNLKSLFEGKDEKSRN